VKVSDYQYQDHFRSFSVVVVSVEGDEFVKFQVALR